MVSLLEIVIAESTGLVKPYDIVQTGPGTLVAEFFFTRKS